MSDTFDRNINGGDMLMRIDAYNAVSQVYQTKAEYKSKATGKQADNEYKYKISDSAKSYSVAKKAVADASDVRMDKVADIKARLAAGTYNVSAEAIADKILGNMETIVF